MRSMYTLIFYSIQDLASTRCTFLSVSSASTLTSEVSRSMNTNANPVHWRTFFGVANTIDPIYRGYTMGMVKWALYLQKYIKLFFLFVNLDMEDSAKTGENSLMQTVMQTTDFPRVLHFNQGHGWTQVLLWEDSVVLARKSGNFHVIVLIVLPSLRTLADYAYTCTAAFHIGIADRHMRKRISMAPDHQTYKYKYHGQWRNSQPTNITCLLNPTTRSLFDR